MSYYIFYNPLSGNGGAEAKANELKAVYEQEASVELWDITAIEDIRAAVLGYGEDDKIILIGGDGTINRFANDICGTDVKCDILFAATGTGNDFLNDIGRTVDEMPFSIKKYITNLPMVEIDGVKTCFLNGIGFGIDGYCCEEGDRLKAEAPEKPVNYTSIAIKGLLGKFKPKNATVTVDGVEYKYKKVWIAAAMHGRFYGGGMMCAPEQQRLSEDGLNTLVVWHGSAKLPTLMAFPSIFKGEHVKKTKMIAVIKGRDITVTFDAPCPLQIDGETRLNVTSYSVSTPALVVNK